MNDTPFIKKGRFTALSVALMFLLPIATAFICLCVGRMSVPLGDVIRAIRSLFTGETAGVQNGSIIVNLRLPRILMAIIVGAGLTCAGNAYQALFSNPLATPDILGVTSGTCVGASVIAWRYMKPPIIRMQKMSVLHTWLRRFVSRLRSR